MRNIVITFGIICLCSLILLNMGQTAIIRNSVPVEAVLGVFAGVFLLAGILIAKKTGRNIAPAASPNLQWSPKARKHKAK